MPKNDCLLLIWKDPETRRNYTVGKLTRGKPFIFQYGGEAEKAEEWCFVITANRFLRNMVRAVVGTLVEVGRGRITIDEFRKIVDNGTRSDAGESMPGNALFLWDVTYPK